MAQITYTPFSKNWKHDTRGVNRLFAARSKKPIIDYGLTQSIIENCRDNMAISHTNLFERKKTLFTQ